MGMSLPANPGQAWSLQLRHKAVLHAKVTRKSEWGTLWSLFLQWDQGLLSPEASELA